MAGATCKCCTTALPVHIYRAPLTCCVRCICSPYSCTLWLVTRRHAGICEPAWQTEASPTRAFPIDRRANMRLIRCLCYGTFPGSMERWLCVVWVCEILHIFVHWFCIYSIYCSMRSKQTYAWSIPTYNEIDCVQRQLVVDVHRLSWHHQHVPYCEWQFKFCLVTKWTISSRNL